MNFTPRKLKSEIKVTHITALWVFNVYKRLRMWEANQKIGKGWDKKFELWHAWARPLQSKPALSS